MHTCPEVSRRAFLLTACGVIATQNSVTAAPTGFHVRGIVSATEHEDMFQIGHEFGLTAAPRTEPHRLLFGLIDKEVRVHVEPT